MSDPSLSEQSPNQLDSPGAQIPLEKSSNHAINKWLVGCMALFIVFSLIGFLVMGSAIVWLLVSRNETQVAQAERDNSDAVTQKTEQPLPDLAAAIAEPTSAAVPEPTKSAAKETPNVSVDKSSDRPLRPLLPLEELQSVKPRSKYRYDWEKIGQFRTSFTLTTQMNRINNPTYRGFITFTYSSDDPASVIDAGEGEAKNEGEAEDEEGEIEATGTGFVVHPGGAILTCAHVVGSATEVELVIDSEKVSGTVVASDQSLDLAIVRVSEPRSSWPHLTFATEDSIEQGNRIQVLGFPLSDALGESLKVNSGAISGFGEGEKGRSIQLDATLNPGNSGGPVVDESGRVIGVADAMLAGGGINPVGFAIPQERAVAFLKENGVDVVITSNASEEGGDFNEVKRTVVFIKVPRSQLESATVLNYEANTFFYRKGQSEKGQTVVDSSGKVLFTTGELMLPVLSKRISVLGIESLPPDATMSWQDRRMTSVTKETITPGSPLAFAGERKIIRRTFHVPVMESSKYFLLPGEETTLSIVKTFRLEAAGRNADKFQTVDASGDYEFDVASATLKSGSFEGTTAITGDEISGTTIDSSLVIAPFTFTYRIQDKASIEQGKKNAEAINAAKARESAAKKQLLLRLKSQQLDKFDPKK